MSTGPMPSADRRTTLLALVRRTNRLMVEELVARLESAGYADITPAQHLVFENIDAAGTRLTTLAQRAGMTRQTMTELVNGLARRGYLELRPDPSDARARLACLTDRGRAIVRHALHEIAAIEARWQQSFEEAGLTVPLSTVLEAGLRAHRDPDR